MSRPEDVTWKPHPRCSKPHGLWSAPDEHATEHEVTAFIAALVNLLKPLTVIETGTYHGHTTIAIADALQTNGTGKLWTYEIDTTRAAAAEAVLEWHVAAGRVTITAAAITSATCPDGVELAFLDSGMRTRQDDLDALWPRLAPGAIIAVHDASPLRPPGRITMPGAHQTLDLATPRGLALHQIPW